ncbi:MAG: hypothetical protein LBJ57_01015 [Prevotellaceae bacterium]|nr:hypothetical protein [Prevotellaceae bacterium]
MKKNFLTWTLAAALLSVGIVACDDDKLDDVLAQPVDVTITVTLPEAYDGISLADVPLDSVKITVGESTLYTDAEGKVSAAVSKGLYNLSATVSRVVVGQNSEGKGGQFLITFLGTKNAEFSDETTTTSIALQVSGTPSFTAYGDIVALQDTIHLWYKGDTVDLAPLFSAVLAPGDERETTFSYEIFAQPQKSETGGNATGEWVNLPDIYVVDADGHSLIAADGLPAAFDLTSITGRKREVSPAVVRATLKAGNTFIAQKDIPVVQDSSAKELIGIIPTPTPVLGNINSRLIPGTSTFTVPTPYADGFIFNVTDFTGYFSDGEIINSLASKIGINEETNEIMYTHYVATKAANANGTSIPAVVGEPVTAGAGGNNTGHPISAHFTASQGVVRNQYRINLPDNNPQVGETGDFYIFPDGTSENDFRTLQLTVKTVEVTGISPLANDNSQMATANSRRFKVGNATAISSIFFANLKVSEGPDRVYVANENNGVPLLTIADSWNTYEGNPTLELVTGTAAQKTAALSVDGGTTYVAAQWIKLTATAAAAPAETPITFKVCPKDKFDAQGNPDPAWTVEVTTKIYAE